MSQKTTAPIYPIGAQVRLASGGPVCTVVDMDRAAGRAIAAWFDDAHGEQEWDLPTVCFDPARNRERRT